MLKKVQVYTTTPDVTTLALAGSPEFDLLQVANIDGLDPVKSSISASSLGSVDGEEITGNKVPSRNIVLTLRPNPDWIEWTYPTLRHLIYSYFTPKRKLRLVFDSDEVGTVEIFGEVESCDANSFSKDPEYVVSIICPDPYFTAVTPVVETGTTIRPDGSLDTINNAGNIPIGVHIKVTYDSGDTAHYIQVKAGDTLFYVEVGTNDHVYFEMNSSPKKKMVRLIDTDSALSANVLFRVADGSNWSVLQPGDNEFGIITDLGDQDWELKYYERYGGL